MEQTPEAMAVVYGEQQLSYAGIEPESQSTGALFTERGSGTGSLVGVCWSGRWSWWWRLLGVLKAGGAYVPLDPSYPEERLASWWQMRKGGVADAVQSWLGVTAGVGRRADRLSGSERANSCWPSRVSNLIR